VKWRRNSVVTAMTALAVVAFNLTAYRVLYTCDDGWMCEVALGGIALPVLPYCLVFSRGQVRIFWAGFTALLVVALIAFVVTTPGSPLWSMKCGYGSFVTKHDRDFVHSLKGFQRGVFVPTYKAIIWFLPQLVIASVGGLTVKLIVGRRYWRLAVP
jgi:hypothetical protein